VRPAAYVLQGDARVLPLADASVQCVVTSPPYWGLRDYGLGPQTLGLEPTPEGYVQHLVAIFREVRRVLRPDGTCWVNLGDSYANRPNANGYHGKERDTSTLAGGGTYQNVARIESQYDSLPPGLKVKDLVGIPWRVAFALQADGWWLRSDIIWAKPNPMPESITDRPTKSHEYLFLLTKAARYYYDGEAIKEPNVEMWSPNGKARTVRPSIDVNGGGQGSGCMTWHASGRNRRSVWTIATEPYPDAHFATFPEKLVEPCILAGTSERGACPACGAPWGREVERERTFESGSGRSGNMPVGKNGAGLQGGGATLDVRRGPTVRATTLGWSPICACPFAEPVPCRVLDPFAGSGTTVAVAERLGRVGIGVELKPAYLTLARQRTIQAGLL